MDLPIKLETLKSARHYLNRKLSVIPVAADKKPLIGWKEYQSKLPTEEDLTTWFKDSIMFGVIPNIGIVTGKISGITVVDVEAGGDISIYPETLTAKTGGGGHHLYYKYHPGVKNLVRIREFTDIRNDGGYCIAPPSETSLGKYEWKKVAELAPFPIEMFDERLMHEKQSKKPQDFPEYVGTEAGNRNDSMTKYLGKILPMWHPLDWEETVWLHFQEINKKNNPPLNDFELRTIYNSIVSREKISPSVRMSQPLIQEDDPVAEVIKMSAVAEMQELRETLSLPTGFLKLDNSMLGGFKEGDLVIITGATGQGKTLFAETLTYNFSVQNISVLFFSYEVIVSNVWKKFQEMGLRNDTVIYSPAKMESGSLDWIERRILYAVEKFAVKVVVLDHLGFLLPRKAKYDQQLNSNYSAYLGQICRDLKVLALKNNLVIILLAHVRKTDKPTINDIRDSSGIAQESDYVFILERELGKPKSVDELMENGNVYTNNTILSMVKNRLTGNTPRMKISLQQGRLQEDYVVNTAKTFTKQKETPEPQIGMF